MVAAIELADVHGGYERDRHVVRGVTISVARGEFVAIIGPNGSGKTTLLRLMAGGLRPSRGEVRVLGRALRDWPRRQLAQRLAVVPQLSIPLFEFTVREFVALGRTPYLSPWAGLSRPDVEAVDRAIAATDLVDLTERLITDLSGGEFQRAVLARALAQEPELLLLDEPTAFLDPGHALGIVSLLRRLNADGVTVVAVFHDLSLALHAGRVLALRDGRIFAQGPPPQVLAERTLTQLYQTPARVVRGDRGEVAIVFVGGESDA